MKDYKLPKKELLDLEQIQFENKIYYNLSKILLKKDLNKKLIIPLGIDENKEKYYIDLEKSNGIFINGETGSGKSVFLDSIIITLLLKNTPESLAFLFIDSHKVELEEYDYIPHLLTETVVYDVNRAGVELSKIINIMKERESLLVNSKCKNISQYNNLYQDEQLEHILIIIDESFDILQEQNNVHLLKQILNQGLNLGVHLIIATNAYLKENSDKEFLKLFDYVLSFDLASEEQAKFLNLKDSNLLTVCGEALVKQNKKIDKIQVPYVSDNDIKRVVEFIKEEN